MLAESPVFKKAAPWNLTMEARHGAHLRAGTGSSPFLSNFDTGLSAVWAFNLAQSFIVSCSKQLPLAQLPNLKFTGLVPPTDLQSPVPAGTVLTFACDSATFLIIVDHAKPLFWAFVMQNVSMLAFEQVTRTPDTTGRGSVVLPGAVFIALTTSADGLTLDQLTAFGILAGPAEVLVSRVTIAYSLSRGKSDICHDDS